jgi:hypothetical protein
MEADADADGSGAPGIGVLLLSNIPTAPGEGTALSGAGSGARLAPEGSVIGGAVIAPQPASPANASSAPAVRAAALPADRNSREDG